MVAPVRVSSVRLSEKKNMEGVDRVSKDKDPFLYGWGTPPVELGYQGIARKAIGNTTLSILSIAVPPLYLVKSGVSMLGEVVKSAVFMTFGAMGLVATPVILAKDLTHHTYRVLSQKPSDSEPSFKKN